MLIVVQAFITYMLCEININFRGDVGIAMTNWQKRYRVIFIFLAPPIYLSFLQPDSYKDSADDSAS